MVDTATGVSKDRFAALIGLAPRSSESNLPSFLSQVRLQDSVREQKELSPLFSIYLSKKDGDDGVITFGGFDVKEFGKKGLTDNDVFWSKASPSEKYWSIELSDVSLLPNGAEYASDTLAYSQRQLILDSGVSYCLVPARDFSYLLNLLHHFGVDCKQSE